MNVFYPSAVVQLENSKLQRLKMFQKAVGFQQTLRQIEKIGSIKK